MNTKSFNTFTFILVTAFVLLSVLLFHHDKKAALLLADDNETNIITIQCVNPDSQDSIDFSFLT